MAHFAKLDDNNLVINVIALHNNELLDENGNESETKGIEFLVKWSGGYKNWVQTSYNRNFRKHYAGVGYTYNKEKDVFIPPQDFPSWVLNEQEYVWEAPTPKPNDGKQYFWNEDTVSWVEIK